MPYVFMVITMVAMVITQLFLRKGMLEVGAFNSGTGLITFFLKAVTNPYIIIAIFTTAIAAGSWLIAVSKAEINRIYPFMGLTFVFVGLLSWPFLGESVNAWRWVGIALVCLGVILVLRN
jgi:drug/metabolite transporter (DMT)-like permease